MVGMENKQGGEGSGRKIEIIGDLGTWELFLEALRLCWKRKEHGAGRVLLAVASHQIGHLISLALSLFSDKQG